MFRPLRTASELDADALSGYLSVPREVSFPSVLRDSLSDPAGQAVQAYGYYYPPRNRDFVGPDSERPPLVVFVHGGPTEHAFRALRLDLQYWTSRGVAVLDVNYGGSSGYGRDYRERLRGRWGVTDVDDVVAGALHLCDLGLADRARLAVAGGSAGGYTTLAALVWGRGTFAAGACRYGIADLSLLAAHTHKFESRYLDGLVGERDRWQRSPVNHVRLLSTPLCILQGTEDVIVPPEQSLMMFEAVKAKGVPVSLTLFEGEQHGFRSAANIRRALDGEFYFISRVFGFEPADVEAGGHGGKPPIEVHNTDALSGTRTGASRRGAASRIPRVLALAASAAVALAAVGLRAARHREFGRS